VALSVQRCQQDDRRHRDENQFSAGEAVDQSSHMGPPCLRRGCSVVARACILATFLSCLAERRASLLASRTCLGECGFSGAIAISFGLLLGGTS
jgi:hypothetical protein